MIKCPTFNGLIFSMLSGIFSTVAVAIAQQLDNLHPGQLSTYYFIAIAAFSLPEATKSTKNILGPKKHRILFLAQSIFTTISSFLNFISYKFLPIGVAIIIASSRPAFIAIAANIILGEPCCVLQYITATLTIVGIIFTAEVPPYLFDDNFSYTKEFQYGITAAMLSVVFTAGQAVVTRKLKSVHHAVVTFNTCWMSVIWTVILTSILGHFNWHECSIHKLYIIGFGFAGYASQTLFVLALQYEFVSPVSTVRAASNICSSFIFQIFLFKIIPDRYNVVGAILVGLSCLFIGVKKCVH